MKNLTSCFSKSLFLLLFLSSIKLTAQIPAVWHTTGIGGGGALFSPSINPANTDEFYVACDMSELFHTLDFGLNYTIIDFRQIQAFHQSAVRFTNNPSIRYCINYANNQVVPVKSQDGGSTWNTLTGNPDNTDETFSIWADFNNPGRVIISYYSIVYYSNDGGNSFTAIHTAVDMGAGVVIGGVFFDGNSIYIGTNDGLIESLNGGVSFNILSCSGIPAGEVVSSFAAAKVGNTLRFFCLTGASNNVYVGQMGSDYWGFLKGVYVMDDNSGTWTPRMNGINISDDYLMYVGMAENDVNTVYLGGSNSSGYPNVMKSTDAGLNWIHVFNTANNQNITTGWCGQNGDHQWGWPECLFGMAVTATNKDVVIFTDYSDVMKTSNGGLLWKQAYVNPADEHPANAPTPVKQYYHSAGLENTSSWGLHWSDASHLFSAFTDIFGIRSQDGGNTWSFDYSGPTTNTMYCVTSNTSNTILYAATSSIHDIYKSYRLQDNIIDGTNTVGKVIFSTDNGATWTELHNFSHPVYWLAIDPNNANRMYAAVVNHTQGLGGIWMTDNLSAGAGSGWVQLTAPPRTEGHPATMTVLNNGKLLCSYSGRRNPSGVFTNSSGVFLYDPASSVWQDKSDPGQYYWCHDVVTDPLDLNQNTWYCGVYSGWGGPPNGLGGLYRTTDAGNSWIRIFNDGDVSSCTFNPLNSNELFVTTHGNGLWVSGNIQQTNPVFTQVESYGFAVPERVFFNPFDQNKIWISSFGHGLQWGEMNANGISGYQSLNQQLEIFPNPASSSISLILPTDSDVNGQGLTFNLLDITGRVLTCPDFSISGSTLTINISFLSNGCYFVEVKTISGTYTGKLIRD